MKHRTYRENMETDWENELELLDSQPFKLSDLTKYAQSIIGDETLKLATTNGKSMSYHHRKNTVLIPRKYIDGRSAKSGLAVLGEMIHELKGHYELTAQDSIDLIKERAERSLLPTKVALFLYNSIEDPRINRILTEEEQYSFIINHTYEQKWKNKNISREIESLPRYKQFGFNIINFWLNGEYLEETSTEVIEALDRIKNEIVEIVYSSELKEDEFDSKEYFEIERSVEATKKLINGKIWSEFETMYLLDLKDKTEESSEDGHGDVDISNTEELPQEFSDTYDPSDIEQMEGKEKGKKFMYSISPPLRGQNIYCAHSIGYSFDKNESKWSFSNTISLYSGNEISGQIHSMSFTVPAGIRKLPLPLPNSFTVNTDSVPSGIDVFCDEEGKFFLRNNGEKEKITIEIGYTENHDFSECGDEAFSSITTKKLTDETEQFLGFLEEKDDLSSLEIAKLLQAYINKKKSYNTSFQGKLHNMSPSAEDYILNIDKADKFECYTANTYGVALLRRLGIGARLNGGFHAKSGKDGTTISSNDGHAWVEVWDDSSESWIIVDFTPPDRNKKDSAEKEFDSDADKENEEMRQNMDDASDEDLENSESNSDNEKKENSDKKNDSNNDAIESEEQNLSLDQSIYRHALRYVAETADHIIEKLEEIKSLEERGRILKELYRPRRKTRRYLQNGEDLGLDSQSLVNATVFGTNCWTQEVKKQKEEQEKIEMFDCEFVVAIDCSGSMGRLNAVDNFSPQEPIDNAFLQMMTILKVSAKFKIPVSVVLFSNTTKTIQFNVEEFSNEEGELNEEFVSNRIIQALREFDVSGNEKNAEAMRESIGILAESEKRKKLIVLVSDGDGSDNPFFSENSLDDIEKNDIYLAALGYGAATEITDDFHGHYLTFIEKRFHKGAGELGYSHMQGIPIGNFSNSKKVVGQLLYDFIKTQSKPSLTTFEELPEYLKQN